MPLRVSARLRLVVREYSLSDNFSRALETVKDVDLETLSAEVKGMIEGVRMTERELKSVFERHGIKPIDPTGQKFDPNRHQAMFEIENTEVPSGTVLQVVQAGSLIGERVLRPAMVGVSKGGPKPAPKAEGDAEPTGDAA